MIQLTIAFSALAIIFLGTIVYYQIKIKKLKQLTGKEIKQELALLETQRQAAQERLKHEQEIVTLEIQSLRQAKLQELNSNLAIEAEKLKQDQEILKLTEKQKLDLELTTLKQEQEKQFLIQKQKQEEFLRKEREAALKKLKEEHELVLSQMLLERTETENLLVPLREELIEYRKKREAINQDILRSRELEMEKDFHRIILTDIDKEDIGYLLSIEDKINNKEVLRKLIWSAYLLAPTNEMINRVLQKKTTKNCIYKITNSVTQEVYIGKTSGEVSNRWKEHIKTSLGVGTVSSSRLHKSLIQYKWDNFTFEVLEKDIKQLGDREKYYINFFESNVYGLNIKAGG